MKPDELPKLSLTRKADGWWIVGLRAADCPEAGPYDTRREADLDRVGLLRTYRFEHVPGFVTCDRGRGRSRGGTAAPKTAGRTATPKTALKASAAAVDADSGAGRSSGGRRQRDLFEVGRRRR